MSHILFPTDFSPVANHAYKFALHLADGLGLELVLFHAYHYAMLETGLEPDAVMDALNRQAYEEAEGHFVKYDKEIQAELGLSVATRYVMKEGYPLEEIVKYAKSSQPQWIVMGTTGAHNAIENFFGSTTAGVMRAAEMPVLAVPPEAPLGPISRIAFATDLQPDAQGVVYAISRLAHTLKAELIRVHIRKHATEEELNELNQIYQGDLLHENIPFHAIGGDSVEEALQDFVKEQNIDLVVVLQHEYSLWQKVFHRSLTRKMVLHSETPILALSE